MEKILLIVDSKGVDKSAFEFACYLAELTRSVLTAIFLDPEPYSQPHDFKKISSELYIGSTSIVDDLPEEHWRTQLAENKRTFALACTNKSIRWNAQVTPIEHVHEIISETRFADLLILNSESTLKEHLESPPTPFVKEILSQSECPVIIAPLDFSGVQEVLFAYDGSASSVYAIKQFIYLFPEFSKMRAVLLQISETEESKITERENIEDYLKHHYSTVQSQVLHGKAGDQLFSSLLGKKNLFVVTGAYGRSPLSLIFKRSSAELLLKTTTLPVFIAHR